jgi:hypothetical protein
MEEFEFSWNKFIEGVSHFDNMVNSNILLSFTPLSKGIPMDPIFFSTPSVQKKKKDNSHLLSNQQFSVGSNLYKKIRYRISITKLNIIYI